MIRPVDAEISQRFGDNPTKHLPASSWLIKTFGNYQPDGHTGEDYSCPAGTPIRAVTGGIVRHVGWYGGTYRDNPYWISPKFAGFCYVIDHGAFVAIYAHGLDGGSRVRAGQRVEEGQVIGLSGNTGGSTGPHLHFEILPDGWITDSYMYGRIDPKPLLASSIAVQGSISQEDELSAAEVQEIKDTIFSIVGTMNEQYHTATRAHIIEELSAKIEDSEYQVKVFTQETDNKNADRVLNGLSAPSVAALVPQEIAQAVIDLLTKRLAK